MPLIETEALILKSYSLAEADKIVVLLTREHGIVRGVAKGAKRLKSRFGSGLEPFSVVNATYFQKETAELVSIQRTDLVASRFEAAGDPEFLGKFAYLADLLTAFSPPHDPNETLYRMTRACIDAAAADIRSLDAVEVYFKLWLLRLSGFLPDWNFCAECRRPFAEGEGGSVTGDHHLLCSNCRRASGGLMLSSTALRIAASGRRQPPVEFAAAWSVNIEELATLSAVLRSIASRSLGREVAREMSFAADR
jgi:DNA repair protein RecO (recombination protein O)